MADEHEVTETLVLAQERETAIHTLDNEKDRRDYMKLLTRK